MASEFFLDTSYAIALSVESDEHHQLAEELAERLEANQTPIVTTRAVLLEIGNALSKKRYREAAGELLDAISYTTALTNAAYFREAVGNIDFMAKDCHGKTADELVALVTRRSTDEKKRIDDAIDNSKVEAYARDIMANLIKSLDDDTEEWKNLTPGKPILHALAGGQN